MPAASTNREALTELNRQFPGWHVWFSTGGAWRWFAAPVPANARSITALRHPRCAKAATPDELRQAIVNQGGEPLCPRGCRRMDWVDDQWRCRRCGDECAPSPFTPAPGSDRS
jgi:hypothetical protein